MRLSHAIEVYLLAKEISGFSPNTLRNYRLTLGRLSTFLAPKDPKLDKISAHQLRAFLHQLQTEPPAANLLIPREVKPLGPKSIRNVHATLASFLGWAQTEGYVADNAAHAIEPPNPKPKVVEPFSEAEIKALLAEVGRGTDTELRLRDRSLLLFLLDTGVRISELCSLAMADVDIRAGSARVRGKGRLDNGRGKERIVMFGNRTRTALHRYLLIRGNDSAKGLLFATTDNRRLDRRHLATHLRRIGRRIGLAKCNPHRFRHSFAIMFLRNGGDIYTLQRLLGHSSLEMVKRYLAIAQTDLEVAHNKAGPVDNMTL